MALTEVPNQTLNAAIVDMDNKRFSALQIYELHSSVCRRSVRMGR